MNSTGAVEGTAVRATRLVKEYVPGAPPALRGVDVEVATGSFLAVMGPSGSGKSTLLHLVGGLDRPTQGEIRVNGQNLTALDDKTLTHLRRSAMGFVFQAYNLVPVLSAEDNIALPAVIAGMDKKDYGERLRAVLELVGLTEHRHKLPSQLSGGEQQRVAVARALLLEPPLLLADEPTGNLDSVTGAQVLRILQRTCAEQGTTIVMVTHDAGAAAYADGVLLLRDGMVLGRTELEREGLEDRRSEVLEFLAADGRPARPAPAARKAARATKATS